MAQRNIKDWVSNKYLDDYEIKKISRQFKQSYPYPYFVLPDFFNTKKISGLRNSLVKEKFERLDKDLFSFWCTMDLSSSKYKAINDFYGFLSSAEFTGLMRNLTGEKLSGRIGMQSNKYKQGDYLLLHDDVVENRKIAYMVYLSSLNTRDGGRLRLYDIKNSMIPAKSVKPQFNLFACFKVSSRSLHDVEEVKSNKERLTVGGWFYGD